MEVEVEQRVASRSTQPTPRRRGFTERAEAFVAWRKRKVARSVDHAAVLAKVDEDACWSGHYLFMIVISAGIAVLGLLLSSPAVVIGAMLISPMMGPIIALGFGIALFDIARIQCSLQTLIGGVLVAVGFCALITLVSPLQTVTAEIAARTRPNLFDLGVAMLSGAGGTYAMIRGRHGAIVGVAIAVAVMPPLATVGFGLASANRSIVLGAAFLFVTNLTAISLTAAVFARIYGFAHQLSPRQGWLQAVLIVTGLMALAVPLGLALRQIGWEGVASRQVRDTVVAQFGEGARIGAVDINFDGKPMEVDAVVFTPREVRGAERRLAVELARLLDRPVAVSIEQVRLGGLEAEGTELAAARGSNLSREASAVTERIALAAGVPPDDVLVDRTRRIVRARATRVPEAGLAVYLELERRVAAASPGWNVELVPPLLPLPDPPQTTGDDDEAVVSPQVETIAWAAQRLNMGVEVSGRGSEQLAQQLRERGIETETGSSSGRTRVEWAGLESR